MGVQTDHQIERKSKRLLKSIQCAYDTHGLQGIVILGQDCPAEVIRRAIVAFNASDQDVLARYDCDESNSRIVLYRNPVSVEDIYPKTKEEK